ncbi:hypothetical protein ACFX12_004394 [Malus domestica]
MKFRVGSLLKLRIFLPTSPNFQSFPKTLLPATWFIFTPATYSTICLTEEESAGEDIGDQPKNSLQVLKQLGCSDTEISMISTRGPSLLNADANQLECKLKLLTGLGITAPELVKIIIGRPRLLTSRVNHCLDERLEFFMTLFGSREVLVKAIVRNPSLLTYDFQKKIKPAIALYQGVGLSMQDLIQMVLLRPTLIPRTSFDEEKMEYIRKTGLSNGSKMYKHVVTIIGVSRLETIRKKVANLEKFGFSEDEIFSLFAKFPLVLTLSVDKVQRNMTFILGQMKLPATTVLEHPCLVFMNLEDVLKPRVLLARKVREMGLDKKIEGPMMMRAMRMTEKRFLKAFVRCHPKDVADELMEYYKNVKGVKRLAEASRTLHQGFPF